MATMNKNGREKFGTFLGVPYDWRYPTKARFVSRVWNPTAPLWNKKWWGWGYDLNAYAVVHPRKWRAARKKSSKR